MKKHKEKPILFSTAMVQAILDGHKTETRRVIKPQPEHNQCFCVCDNTIDEWLFQFKNGTSLRPKKGAASKPFKSPYGLPGDLLYVRESFAPYMDDPFQRGGHYEYHYKTDKYIPKHIKWKPSIHMPKSASRIWLKVTDVRVERVQDIGWDDAVAEGCPGYRAEQDEPAMQFQRLWDSINADRGYSWESDPWVWVVKFEVISTEGKP